MKKWICALALFMSAMAGASQLSETVTIVSANVNLTTVGAVDWSDWNGATATLVASDWKNGAGHTIPNPTVLGGTAQAYNAYSQTFNWTDGTNTATSSNAGGIFNNGSTDGFQFVFPADTNVRTLYVYITGYNITTACSFVATLSDGSAGPASNTTTFLGAANANIAGVVTLVYQAASAAQTLTFQMTLPATGGQNLGVQAVALASVAGPPVNGVVLSNGHPVKSGTSILYQ